MKKTLRKSILVVDDDESFQRLIKYTLKKQYCLLVAASAEHAMRILAKRIPDLILLDIMLPRIDGIELLKQVKATWPDIPVLMLTATDKIPIVVECMKLGSADYLTKPIKGEELLLKIEHALTNSRMRQDLAQRRELQQIANRERRLIGTSSVFGKIRQQIRIVGKTDATVLIEGETGTGKELVARAIHACSSRAGGPFVALNCGAIPGELMEAEFFGHSKGAFTGAQTAGIGKFQLANHGTLLLDEVSELSLKAQTKLLRVLEEQEFYPVGSNQLISVDVRVIASTNKALEDMMEQGTFREDLFFRLHVYSIFIPPLREHPEDILPLAEYYIEQCNRTFKKTFTNISPEARESLMRCPWRGNVRNLRNLIERIVLSEEGPTITKEHIAVFLHSSCPTKFARGHIFHLPERGIDFEELEKQLLIQALQRAKSNKTKAAKLLHLSRPTFLYRLDKYGLT